MFCKAAHECYNECSVILVQLRFTMSYIISNIIYYAVCQYTSYVFHQFSCFRDTHALIKFLEEDATAIIPVHRIQKKETLEYGGLCGVVWSNKKVYKGF